MKKLILMLALSTLILGACAPADVPDVPDVSVKKLPPSGLFAWKNPCAGEIFIRHSGTAAREAGGEGYVRRGVKVYFGG